MYTHTWGKYTSRCLLQLCSRSSTAKCKYTCIDIIHTQMRPKKYTHVLVTHGTHACMCLLYIHIHIWIHTQHTWPQMPHPTWVGYHRLQSPNTCVSKIAQNTRIFENKTTYAYIHSTSTCRCLIQLLHSVLEYWAQTYVYKNIVHEQTPKKHVHTHKYTYTQDTHTFRLPIKLGPCIIDYESQTRLYQIWYTKTNVLK